MNRRTAGLFVACVPFLACARDETPRPRPHDTTTAYTAERIAPVTVVEFFDYGCHYCAEFDRAVLRTIRREYVASGRVRWQLIPFGSSRTSYAADAAAALECATQQDALWPMHDAMFARRPEWMLAADRAARLRAIARDVSLDDALFAACLRSAGTRRAVASAANTAREMSVRIAPTFIVSGHRIEGVATLEELQAAFAAAAR